MKEPRGPLSEERLSKAVEKQGGPFPRVLLQASKDRQFYIFQCKENFLWFLESPQTPCFPRISVTMEISPAQAWGQQQNNRPRPLQSQGCR